jgi:hypothetical protein
MILPGILPPSQPSPRGEGAIDELVKGKDENCSIFSPLGEIRKGVNRLKEI